MKVFHFFVLCVSYSIVSAENIYSVCNITEKWNQINSTNETSINNHIIYNDQCCLIDTGATINKLLNQMFITQFQIMMQKNEDSNITSLYYNLNLDSGNIEPIFLELKFYSDKILACIKMGIPMQISDVSWTDVIAIRACPMKNTQLSAILERATNIKYLDVCKSRKIYVENTTLNIYGINTIDVNIDAPQLKKLILYSTPLSFFYNNFTVDTINSIETIGIHGSVIDSLSDLILEMSFFPSLVTINASHSHINSMFSTELALTSVKTLDLSYCNIQSFISYGEMNNNFPSLKSINLTGNPLTCIRQNFFVNMKFLKEIKLAQTFLLSKKHIIQLAFNTSENIDTLDLSSNELVIIHIKSQKTIVTLDTSFNKLTMDNLLLDCNVPQCVDTLNITYNNLVVNTNILKSIETFKVIDMGNNTVSCSDCNFLKNNVWNNIHQNNTNVKVLDLNRPGLMCTSPDILKGKFVNEIDINVMCPVDHSVVASVVIIGIIFTFILVAGLIYRREIVYSIQYIKLKMSYKREQQCRTQEIIYDAFIAYSRHDRNWVWNDLRHHLENGREKYKLCLHERDFPLGSLISENIETSLSHSKHCIMVLTNNFIKNKWCQWEVKLLNYMEMMESYETVIIIGLDQLHTSNYSWTFKRLIINSTYIEWNLEKRNEASLIKHLKQTLGKSIYIEKAQNVLNEISKYEMRT